MYNLQVQLREISHQFVLQKHVGIMKTKKDAHKKIAEKYPSFTKIPELNTNTLTAFENVFFPIHGATESDLRFWQGFQVRQAGY